MIFIKIGDKTMINMGIIGFGRMGMVHADIISKIKDLNLIAVSKKSSERSKEIRDNYGVEVYTDNDKLLDIREIDYVVISTTNETHEELTIKALNKGKNVIVEKPMSINYQSTLRMIKAAEENKKNLFVYHNFRWDRDFLFVKSTIESGKLGNILVIKNNYGEFGESWAGWGIHGMENPWRIKAEYGGGILLDMGPHLVDQILLLMGKDPIGVYGMLQSSPWSGNVDNHFFAIIRFDSNIICQIEISNNCRISLPRWYVIGTKGVLEVAGLVEYIYDNVKINYIKDNGEKEIQKIKLVDSIESGLTPGFYKDLVKFLKGEIKEFVSMYQASKIIKILDLIRKSSEENRYVNFE